MQIGIILGDVQATVPPREHLDQLLRQVDAAQRNGFTYITIGQHFLYGDLRWLQPVPTLARLAAEVGSDVRLVTTVILVPFYHPVILAEELATLDIVTGGRLVIGAGLGYRKEEYRQLGIPFEERVARFEEGLTIMRRLWTEDVVSHQGRFWTLDEARPHLRSIQEPHPPLWIGGQSVAGVRRAARLGDAWAIPPEFTVATIREWIDVFQRDRAELGLALAAAFPLRREVMVGRTRADAVRTFAERARARYIAYAQRERTWTASEDVVTHSLEAEVGGHLIAGSADECMTQIQELAREVPVDPLIVRADWPGMTSDDVVGYLDDLGRELVPAINSLAPRSVAAGSR